MHLYWGKLHINIKVDFVAAWIGENFLTYVQLENILVQTSHGCYGGKSPLLGDLSIVMRV